MLDLATNGRSPEGDLALTELTQLTQPRPAGTRGGALSVAERRVIAAAAVILGLLVLAPITLSTLDLFAWATSDTGLGLDGRVGWLVPVGLDLAALFCIAMTVLCTLRGSRPGIWSVLVWLFAGTSAWSQHQHGVQVAATGGPGDVQWAMPAFAIIGPLLLEVGLHYGRRWLRQDSGELFYGAAGFGLRWLPGIAFRETAAAWAASRREGIASAADAIAYVRQLAALAGMTEADALRYAVGALRSAAPDAPVDLHAARVWLQARHVLAGQSAVAEVAAEAASLAATRKPLAKTATATPSATGGLAALSATRLPAKSVPATGGPRDAKSRQALALVADGLAVAEACDRTGAAVRTVERWAPSFRHTAPTTNGHAVLATATTGAAQ